MYTVKLISPLEIWAFCNKTDKLNDNPNFWGAFMIINKINFKVLFLDKLSQNCFLGTWNEMKQK